MKTLYKKALIIGGTSLLLEAIIVYFLYTSINAFYADLTNRMAFLLVEQIKNGIAADRIDFSKLSPYNKYPIRRLMNRFSGINSEILHILLIDTTNIILVSDDPTVEGKVYKSAQELHLLETDQPVVVNRNWEGNQEIVDVVIPLMQDSVKQGLLRTVISVKHLQNFYQSRRVVLIFASIFALGIIILAVFLTSRIYQTNLQNIENALTHLHDSNYKYRVKYPKQDEFAPLFARLNELFKKTLDLNESFRHSQERINAMMRVIHEGLMILDVNMNIISYNEYLLDLFNLPAQNHIEEKIYKIFFKNPKLREIYRRARDPMTHAVRHALSVNLLDGDSIDVQVHALSIMEGENRNNVIFYIKNIAVLKELEQNLNRSMKYTIISQLASSIGHEIRNPLSSLAIHTEVLDNLVTQLPADQEKTTKINKSIKILNTEIERLTKLIDQFFNLAKPKEIELSYKKINLIIREVYELLQQEAIEKNINLHLRLAKNIPLVNISHDQIKQVILNIVLNALDAMPEGGDLYFITRELENKVQIIIEDTGNGIPVNIQDKIFDTYFSTKPGGGGIGLAISNKIIEAHEGNIFFNSVENEGTKFIIELPRV